MVSIKDTMPNNGGFKEDNFNEEELIHFGLPCTEGVRVE